MVRYFVVDDGTVIYKGEDKQAAAEMFAHRRSLVMRAYRGRVRMYEAQDISSRVEQGVG